MKSLGWKNHKLISRLLWEIVRTRRLMTRFWSTTLFSHHQSVRGKSMSWSYTLKPSLLMLSLKILSLLYSRNQHSIVKQLSSKLKQKKKKKKRNKQKKLFPDSHWGFESFECYLPILLTWSCNKCCTFLHHNPVSIDCLYCMSADWTWVQFSNIGKGKYNFD